MPKSSEGTPARHGRRHSRRRSQGGYPWINPSSFAISLDLRNGNVASTSGNEQLLYPLVEFVRDWLSKWNEKSEERRDLPAFATVTGFIDCAQDGRPCTGLPHGRISIVQGHLSVILAALTTAPPLQDGVVQREHDFIFFGFWTALEDSGTIGPELRPELPERPSPSPARARTPESVRRGEVEIEVVRTKIRQAVQQSGQSYEQIGRRMGFTEDGAKSAVARILSPSSKHNPSLKTLLRLAAAIGRELRDIL